MYNAFWCFIDFVRMASDYPNKYMRPDLTKAEWENCVYDTSPLVLGKWGF